MAINKSALQSVGVTEEDFKKWCEQTHRSTYSTASKKEFFSRIRTGRLAKNAKGELVVKKPRRK